MKNMDPGKTEDHGEDPRKRPNEPPDGNEKRNKGQETSPGSRQGGNGQGVRSRHAREIERITEIARNTPDIRVKKVEALKRMIDSGSYDVKSSKVAERILDEIRNGPE